MSTMMSPAPRKHRITVDEYCRMADVGLLAPDARVELIEGEIIDKAPPGIAHEAVVDFINQSLSAAVGKRAIVRVQGTVKLDDFSLPQPDFVLLAPRDDFYGDRRAAPSDVLLVIEVSYSSARYDRHVKVPLYARRQIPELWLVDLRKKLVTFFRSPIDGRYVEEASSPTPSVTPVPGLPGATVDLTRVLSL
ncbi:MAG: Uma2 family endonuclease [Steroidobacteraceae bacterium]